VILSEIKPFKEAAQRISGKVHHTPVFNLNPKPSEFDFFSHGEIFFKLENLQVTGSFKARGAANKLLTLTDAKKNAGLVTASGGNHGLAVAWAAASIKVPSIVFLPQSTPEDKIIDLKSYGAQVFVGGRSWDDANSLALETAKSKGMTYIHPFADPAVIAGQGTIGLEIIEQVRNVDTIIVAIGGGGLIAGIAAAVKCINPTIRIIGVEPIGAPTLYESLKNGKIVTLQEISTNAGTLAPRRTMPINYEIIASYIDKIILVSDEEMKTAAQVLWQKVGIAVELSAAATFAALMTKRYLPQANEKVVAVICGKGKAGF
jgi:threonine dehydratase